MLELLPTLSLMWLSKWTASGFDPMSEPPWSSGMLETHELYMPDMQIGKLTLLPIKEEVQSPELCSGSRYTGVSEARFLCFRQSQVVHDCRHYDCETSLCPTSNKPKITSHSSNLSRGFLHRLNGLASTEQEGLSSVHMTLTLRAPSPKKAEYFPTRERAEEARRSKLLKHEQGPSSPSQKPSNKQ
ncbi:uncharacterized protein BO97DRAFT_413544 [Aspergillus homomorphus CBS 101889]|uniref:Uncharacterized protein n=1 Tax=Aspergillus homomorphus (strain CBS 101889) TaxID=1450537 RepID=A0A395HZF2_ASPHC|nr:hypothetical protein BO97DRAFT_413544 [Aspergillus homomorphus CBS 101889]RAL13077.1 hypothetical protein BO97DRAFT_413544 [Aspergillus homomorphus CBS 101889]